MRSWWTIAVIGLAATSIWAWTYLGGSFGFPNDANDPGTLPNLAALGGAQALSGDQIRYGKRTFTLKGVSCPDPKTEAGRYAKSLANTFLRIDCMMDCSMFNFGGGWTGDCTANTSDGKRKLSEVLVQSGYCS